MKKLLTTKELSEYLSVSRWTINDWRKAGMPFLKLNRVVRFELDKVMQWLEEEGKRNKEEEQK